MRKYGGITLLKNYHQSLLSPPYFIIKMKQAKQKPKKYGDDEMTFTFFMGFAAGLTLGVLLL